ncbi:MAG: DNA double-strand break repair nuclease NurA [Candidatus Altiarchaeota archaeon]|nr:DNA double-strand break repair nuclease NurA [Candidatus Altiarchaeota archaeon]
MKPLEKDTGFELDGLDELFKTLTLDEGETIERSSLRLQIESAGYAIKRLKPGNGKLRFLAADCSMAFKELRYHALWATNAVAVYAVFDGVMHSDSLVGHSKIPYHSLKFANKVSIGEITPYVDADVRAVHQRLYEESKIFNTSIAQLDAEGVDIDLILVDGSLTTNIGSAEKGVKYPEGKAADTEFKRFLRSKKTVGMVEDSHSAGVAQKIGYSFTDILLFDIALDEGEYVVEKDNGVNICYVKLPGKKLPHEPDTTEPLTVRWEFNYDDFEKELAALAGIWQMEDDILHPQTYPLRIADYLTRRVKVNGILDMLIQEKGLGLKYRELRTS